MLLPKVLIIGESFNHTQGGGITLCSLFKGWDREKLAVACSGYSLLGNIDTAICGNYYQLGYNENKWRFPFNFLQRKYSSGLVKFEEKKIKNITIAKSKIRIKIIMNFFYPLLEYFGLYHYFQKSEISKDFRYWLKDFNPDVIYVQATSRAEILFCLSVHSYLQKPLIYHVMDDWPSIISQKGPFKNFWQKKIDKDLKSLLSIATILMSISEEMAREYKTRYNKTFITFHNAINIDFWKKHQRDSYDINNKPSILYAGRLGLGIDKSLELFAKAIQQVNEELSISIKFTLQTQEKPLWTNNYENTIIFFPIVKWPDYLPKLIFFCCLTTSQMIP
jgi:hypothetical protein